MPGPSARKILALGAALLLFSQCEVLRDLTTEPKGTPPGTAAGRSRPASMSEREQQLRDDVVSYAHDHLGTRYKYAGKSPKQGFDCSGFTHYVMNNFDIRLSPSSRAQEGQGRSIKVAEAKAGDLIFFRRSKNGAVFHVALVVSNDREGLRVIHSTSRGVVVDNITESKYWKPKISTARDVIGQ